MIVKRVKVDYYEVDKEKYHKWYMENVYDPDDLADQPIEVAEKEVLFDAIEDDEPWWSYDWWGPVPGGEQTWAIEEENENEG